MNRFAAIALAILSGLLLSTAFPPLDIAVLAWAALTPLLLACMFVTPRRALALGAITGSVFWFSSLWWLLRVTWAGMIAVCLYNSLYIAVFAWAVAASLRLPFMRGRTWNFAPIIVWPALWVATEFLRGTLFTGFPWSPLGNALYRNLFMAQAAEWGGVHVLSFLAVLPCVGVALTLARFAKGWRAGSRVPHLELWASVLLVAVCFHTGQRRFFAFRNRETNMTVAAVQPNVPQLFKWDESLRDLIYTRLQEGSAKATEKLKPDLIIWPETALPDYVLYSADSYSLVTGMLPQGVPMLVGSLHYVDEQPPKHYNSAFLFLPGQEGEPDRYDKKHLVIFGEYVPFERYFEFLRALTPIPESITPGIRDTVFWLPGTRSFFSALICFEDVFPWIARRFVKAGARMLVNQTNDAWFDPSPASRQHLAHSVIRAIENRVPVVRSANTGVTCVIDRNGEIIGSLPVGAPGAAHADCLVKALFVPENNMPLSFYTRFGEWFAWSCLALSGLLPAALCLPRLRRTARA